MSQISSVQNFCAKLWDSFLPNLTTDVVNIVWTFEQLVNQISWLYDRINTQNYPYLPPKSAKQNYPLKDGYITRNYRESSSRKTFVNATKIDKQNKTNETIRRKYQKSCLMCSKNHRFFKCPNYRELKPTENFISWKKRSYATIASRMIILRQSAHQKIHASKKTFQ